MSNIPYDTRRPEKQDTGVSPHFTFNLAPRRIEMSHTAPPSRILLIRPSALGDVCRTVPVLVSLKRRFPESTIDWLVQDVFAPAVRSHPDLGGVVPFPRRAFAGWWRHPDVSADLLRWLRSLKRREYDLVVDCQGLARSGVFAWATRAPRRIGYSNAAEAGWLGLTERYEIPREMHTVDRMLGLIERAGIPPVHDLRLYASSADRAELGNRLDDFERIALIGPTSRWPGKRWPADRFDRVVHALLADNLVDAAALVGAASERDQCAPLIERAARDERVVDLLGATSVGGLLAAVERSSLVIANDSAALHMAVGFEKPIVALFGPTRVDRVGPYGRADSVIQRIGPDDALDHKNESAGAALMRRIQVDDVLDRARAELDMFHRGTSQTGAAASGRPG